MLLIEAAVEFGLLASSTRSSNCFISIDTQAGAIRSLEEGKSGQGGVKWASARRRGTKESSTSLRGTW